jgi:hypothetical protein
MSLPATDVEISYRKITGSRHALLLNNLGTVKGIPVGSGCNVFLLFEAFQKCLFILKTDFPGNFLYTA